MRTTIHLIGLLTLTLGLRAQIYETAIPLTQATQGIAHAEFINIGGAGYQDILATTVSDGRIVWYNGDGEGSFLAEESSSTGAVSPLRFAVTDLDQDWDQDLVSVDLEGHIYFHERLSQSEFAPAVLLVDLDTPTRNIGAEDINGDGLADIVIGAQNVGLIYFPSEGDGTIGEYELIYILGTESSEFVFGEFNGDGYTDMVFTTAQSVIWSAGSPDGGFSSFILLKSLCCGRDLEVVDLDSDGDNDIVLTSQSFGEVIAFFNTGFGAFTEELQFEFDFVRAVKALDIDGDNDVDMVVANGWQAYTVLKDGGAWGTPQAIGEYDGQLASLDAKDVDNDGRVEILLASSGPNGLQYFESNDAGVIPSRVISADAIGVVDLQLADIDGDGDKDLVSASAGDHKISWYENMASGQYGTQRYITDRASSVYDFLALDFYGAGVQEILMARTLLSGNSLLWLIENDGTGSFAYPVSTISAFGPTVMTSGHLDLDNKEDVVYAVDDTNGILVRVKVDDQNALAVHLIDSGTNEIVDLEIADMNGDGNNDVVVSLLDHGMSWYKNNGDGISFDESLTIDDDLEIYHNFSCQDLDQDGDSDIVACVVDGADPEIYWYENDGTGSFVRHATGLSCLPEFEFSVADMEGDGDLDILYSITDAEAPYWARNLGDNTFVTDDAICVDCGAIGPYTAAVVEDVDGDADMDIYFVGEDIYFIENTGLICPADINRDQVVDVNDFIILNSNFGQSCTGYCPADINGDGIVDIDDFLIWNSAFGTACD